MKDQKDWHFRHTGSHHDSVVALIPAVQLKCFLICLSLKINIVDVISDAMYSDSKFVIDALAEFIDAVVERHQVAIVSEERMTQVRYIMQVDEVSFRSRITSEQLVAIESKEMSSILNELISAVGLQRFRFIERQNNGMSDSEKCIVFTGSALFSLCMLERKKKQIFLSPRTQGTTTFVAI